jgi:hypothetical protein
MTKFQKSETGHKHRKSCYYSICHFSSSLHTQSSALSACYDYHRSDADPQKTFHRPSNCQFLKWPSKLDQSYSFICIQQRGHSHLRQHPISWRVFLVFPQHMQSNVSQYSICNQATPLRSKSLPLRYSIIPYHSKPYSLKCLSVSLKEQTGALTAYCRSS